MTRHVRFTCWCISVPSSANLKAAQGIGMIVNQAKFTAEGQEKYFWKMFFLGNKNSDLVCFSLFGVLGIFSLL